MIKLRTIIFLCAATFSMCINAQVADGVLTVSRGKIHNSNGPHSGIPIVSSDDDDVTISCDSLINDVTVIIHDQWGNVMHRSTQTISPSETTIYVPNTDDSEKTTIDLYYDRKHLSGYFKE